MNYKVKWLFNLLIFPLVSLTPMFTYFIIQSTQGSGSGVLPNTTSFVPWILLFYIPVYLIITLYYYLDINGWRNLKWNGYLLIGLFSVGFAFITFLMYYVISFFSSTNYENVPIATIVILLIILVGLGMILFQMLFKLFGSILSYRGPSNYAIYRLAYSLSLSTLIRRWTFYVDAFAKIGDNHYENYSVIFTKKAIFLLDFVEYENDFKLTFEHEIEKEVEVKKDFLSLLIDNNFAHAKEEKVSDKQEVRDIFEELNQSKLIYSQIKYAPSILEKTSSITQIGNSDYINGILYRREHFLKNIQQNKTYMNLDAHQISEIPIINVLIIENADKLIEGSNEDFIITSSGNLLRQITELDNLLSLNPNISKVKKVFLKKCQ